MRIGEVADRTGLTSRAIRYYEEVGLLPGSATRAKGQHRSYDEADVAQLSLINSLSTLLGASLEQIQELVRPAIADAVSDERWGKIDTVTERLRVVESALVSVTALLELVKTRRSQLLDLQLDLEERLVALESRRVVGAA
jgi:MerR family transcriptional regulator, repressor of the yfmOP operon